MISERAESTGAVAEYVQGNIAAAEGALAAGCTFYAGYPITPSSEIMHHMAVKLRQRDGVFIQMEDEIASIAAITGAAWAGCRSMTATSGPGLSLMMEGIGYAAMTETPCVIVDVQRAGPSTGQATHVGSGDILQVRFGSHGDYHPIALSPWSVQEMFDLTVRAFDLSERFRTPAFLLADESVGHLRESALLSPVVDIASRPRPEGAPALAAPFGSPQPGVVPPMPHFGEGANLLITGSTHDEWGFRKVDDPEVHHKLVTRLTAKVLARREEIVEVERYHLDDAEVAVLAYGFTARCALAAVKMLRREGLAVGLLRLKTLWPFPDREIAELGALVHRLLIPEMNLGQVASLVRQHAACEVLTLNQVNGKVISPGAIADKVREM